MSQKQYDFTQGPILKQIILFSGPIITANLLQTSYQLIDSLWVGNLLGAKALGAVSISSAIIFVVLAFAIGINNAALTILSQQKGMNDKHRLKNYLNAFVVTLSILSLLFSLFGYFSTELLLNLLSTPEEIMEMAMQYLRINFIGVLFLFGYNFISTVLRALGDSKSPLQFVLIATVLNAILDPLMIATFNFGVAGAAYATIISQGFALTYGLFFVLTKKLAPFSMPTMPKMTEIALILKLGIPGGLQMAVISAGSAAITGVFAQFGAAIVGGYGAAQRLDSLIMLPAQSLGTALNSMAGQNISVNRWSRVKSLAKLGLIYNFLIMICIGLFVFVFAQPLIELFIKEAESVQFASKYLKVLAFSFPFLGINFILNGIVRGAGAMYQVLVLNIISFWVLRYPLAYLFGHLFGADGIAYGLGLSFVISSIIAIGYYKYGKWRNIELF